jgi:hypothetical protein
MLNEVLFAFEEKTLEWNVASEMTTPLSKTPIMTV